MNNRFKDKVRQIRQNERVMKGLLAGFASSLTILNLWFLHTNGSTSTVSDFVLATAIPVAGGGAIYIWFSVLLFHQEDDNTSESDKLEVEEQQIEPLSENTKQKIDSLAADVENIPEIGFLSGAALYSRHFDFKPLFDWVESLNEIVDDSSSPRSHVVDRFLEQVDVREPTDEEKALANTQLPNQTANKFYCGEEVN